MINRDNFVSINLLKKETFTGSLNGMRYRLIKNVTGEGDNQATTLLVTIWPQPYNFVSTDDSLKTSKEFEYSKEGIQQAADWLNQSYIDKKTEWKRSNLWNIVKE